MIIAQDIFIVKSKISALVNALQSNGYTIDHLLLDDHPCIAFDAYTEDDLSFFRFERSPDGDIVGLCTIDDTGMSAMLGIMAPFVTQGSSIFFTGGHQCELRGYYVGPDGIYEATNIRVISDKGFRL